MQKTMFRAKKIKSDLWIHGDLISDKYIYDNSKHLIKLDRYIAIKPDEIDPTTICQFSGLKDKNNVDIYEKDIICAIGEDSSIIIIECPEIRDLISWIKIKNLLKENNTAQKIGDLFEKKVV